MIEMKSKKTNTTVTIEKDTAKQAQTAMFTKDNIMWMVIGVVIIIIGCLLMAGGRNEDPNVFDENKVYSTTRITIAPILILTGLAIEVFALFRNPKKG